MPMTTRSWHSDDHGDLRFEAPAGKTLDDEDVVQADCAPPDYAGGTDPHNGGVDDAPDTDS